jgi:hypothetical protein
MTAPARRVPDLAAAEAVAVLMTEVSEGMLTAATMTEAAVRRCREVFGTCDGPTDPLWPVHVDLCRAVLGHGGLSASELAQWLGVARSRENPHAGCGYPSAQVSPLSRAHGPDSGDAEPDAETEPRFVVPEVDTVDTSDILADIPPEVLVEAEAAALAVIENYRREAGR